MELFNDGSNSPLPNYLPDFFDLRLRSMNSIEDAFSCKVEGLFDDPEFGRSVASLEREDFLIDINKLDIQDVNIFDVTRKIKKTRRKPDYKKNICGYITKRIIREFVGDKYTREVQQLCGVQGCNIDELRSYFLSKLETITGPRHLEALLRPITAQETPMKRVFIQFFQWFMKERYVRYLLCDGKMSDKRAYVDYKNTVVSKYLKAAKQFYKMRQEEYA